MPALDEYGHLAIEERQQQRSYVTSVNISISHDNYAVIAQLVDMEVVAADAAAEGRDESAHLRRCQHLVEARLLDVEDFPLQWEDGLSTPVASLLGRAAGGVAFDQEHFGECGILLLAVRELARQPRDIERALTARHFACLARGFACVGGL